MTAIPGGAGGEVLLAAVEGSAARIARVDPSDGSEATDLDLEDFLAQALGIRVNYKIDAYNDMTPVHAPSAHGHGSGDALMLGLEAFIPRNQPVPAGHSVVDVGYGQVESGGWYLVRSPDGRYDLHRVAADAAHPPVATRSIRASPFPGDGHAVYFAGYDANKAPAHNTAWIARAARRSTRPEVPRSTSLTTTLRTI